jgi:hypothetical protein
MSVNLALFVSSTARASRPPTIALAAPIITMSRRLTTVARTRASRRRLRDDDIRAETRDAFDAVARGVIPGDHDRGFAVEE